MTTDTRAIGPPFDASTTPIASPRLWWHGREVFRLTGFVTKLPLRCPDGHAVSEPACILEDGVIFCDHRAGKGQAQCGALIYLLVLPGRGNKRRLWAAHLTREEHREIERLGLDADGVLAYFGATFTR